MLLIDDFLCPDFDERIPIFLIKKSQNPDLPEKKSGNAELSISQFF